MNDYRYRTGFPNGELFEQFQDGVERGDCHQITRAVTAQKREVEAVYGRGTYRLPTDVDINATYSPDTDLMTAYPLAVDGQPPSMPGTAEYDAEVKQVAELATLRDVPFDSPDLAHLPEGLRRVSWFLKDVKVRPYAAGVDYITDKAEWDRVMSGSIPSVKQKPVGRSVKIKTGRHAARYVHGDDPLITWMYVCDVLTKLGALQKKEGENELTAQASFASWGKPFLYGVLGEVLRRVGMLSFRQKWAGFNEHDNQSGLMPRPYQYYYENFGEFLPQAYAEGSPTHPDRNAMHSVAAIALGHAVKLLFDSYIILPNGRTARDEINLKVNNLGEWRFWGGVHIMSAHESARKRAEMVAERVVNEFLNPGVDARPELSFMV